MAGLAIFQNAKSLGVNLAFDDDADATAAKNLDGGATQCRCFVMDNSALASIVYLRMWDNTAPVVGTTAADYQFPVPASKKRTIIMTATFDDGLTYVVTTDTGTTANTDPGAPPDLYAATNGGTTSVS
jgi:hypothetical protein